MENRKGLDIRNLIVRTLSAICLIPLVTYAILSNTELFYAALGFVVVIMVVECYGMIKNLSSKWIWSIVALIYVSLFAFSFCWIRNQEGGRLLLLWITVTAWTSDTGAFIFGKMIGGPKFAPKVSPAKTWAGLIGAVIFACATGAIFYRHLNISNVYNFIGIASTFGIIGQLGDLLESWIKRKAHIKDSGKIIPGHGGILDRVDSLVLCSVVLMIFLALFKK